jgi:hypothetical protein
MMRGKRSVSARNEEFSTGICCNNQQNVSNNAEINDNMQEEFSYEAMRSFVAETRQLTGLVNVVFILHLWQSRRSTVHVRSEFIHPTRNADAHQNSQNDHGIYRLDGFRNSLVVCSDTAVGALIRSAGNDQSRAKV